MTKCNSEIIGFPALKTKNFFRKVELNFSGGEVTSDGGVLLLSRIDSNLGLTRNLAPYIKDPRNPSMISHSNEIMLKQRVYSLGLAYEDLNDQATLRQDTALQTAVGRDSSLASPSTLCRFENRGDRSTAIGFHKEFFNQFISSFKQPPTELIFDFDSTDDRVHGNQEGRHYHGYYEDYCFLPLYVFCGDQLLVSYLRPSNIDGAKHAWAIAALLVKAVKKKWSDVQIIFRGDSGFCRHKMLRWFEKQNVKYIVGLPSNSIVKKNAASLVLEVENNYNLTLEKQKKYGEFFYAAQTWGEILRRVIVKAEHNALGENTRFIMTNLEGTPQDLYEKIYCARGEMENRIKEVQLCLFSDRTSCHDWWPNQFRMLLSSVAYILLETLRRVYLSTTDLAQAQVDTLKLKLLKIGAVIIRNTRRIKFYLSSYYPNKKIFIALAKSLFNTT